MKKKMTLIRIFACNSKSVLPQRTSFSHAGTHIVMNKEYKTTTIIETLKWINGVRRTLHANRVDVAE